MEVTISSPEMGKEPPGEGHSQGYCWGQGVVLITTRVVCSLVVIGCMYATKIAARCFFLCGTIARPTFDAVQGVHLKVHPIFEPDDHLLQYLIRT